MCKVLLAVFLALSLATSASAPLDDGFVLTARVLPSKQMPVYNTAFDDDQRGLKPFAVAIQDFPFLCETLSRFRLAEVHRHLYLAILPTPKLSTVLLI
jgi:hypothetical protein